MSPRRGLAGLAGVAVLILLGSACADDEGSSTAPVTEAADTGSDATVTGSTDAPSPADGGSGASPEEATSTANADATAPDPAPAVPWPAPALPVKEAFVIDQPVWYPSYLDQWLFMGSALGVGRLDPDTGEFEQITTVRDDQFHNTYDLSRATEGGVMVLTDTEGIGGRGAIVMLDPVTFQEIGRIDDQAGYLFGWDGDQQVIAIADGERYQVLDTVTLDTTLLPVPAKTLAIPTVLGDEVWTLNADGSVAVYDRTSGDELRRADLPLTGGQGRVRFAHTSDEHIWVVFAGQAVLVKLDRATLDVVDQVDVAELHDAPQASNLLTAGRYYLVRVFDESGGGWTVLARYDYEAGELVHAHTVAPTSPLYGWDIYVNAHWIEAGDRLFVQDHRRRIVEVDVDRLTDPSTEAWEDPGLAREPVLTPVEQEVGDVVLASVNDGVKDRRTRPDAVTPGVEAEVSAFAARWGGFDVAEYRLDSVAIDGDRAWVWAFPVDENGENPTGALPGLWVMRRVDGEWFIDTDWTCIVIASLGLDCAA